jgi:hypothetical protein
VPASKCKAPSTVTKGRKIDRKRERDGWREGGKVTGKEEKKERRIQEIIIKLLEVIISKN